LGLSDRSRCGLLWRSNLFDLGLLNDDDNLLLDLGLGLRLRLLGSGDLLLDLLLLNGLRNGLGLFLGGLRLGCGDGLGLGLRGLGCRRRRGLGLLRGPAR